MKRIFLTYFTLGVCVFCIMAKNPESEAKKKAKQLTKAGWVLYNPSGLALDKQILAERILANTPSKYDKSHQAYIIDTQIGKDRRLEDALEKARNACYSNLASLLQTEISSMSVDEVMLTSSNGGNVQTKEEFLNIMGTRSRECLRNVEDGLVIYRRVKDVYEVQMTLRIFTDTLYE